MHHSVYIFLLSFSPLMPALLYCAGQNSWPPDLYCNFIWVSRQTMHKSREVIVLFPAASGLLHGNKGNTTSPVEVTEPVPFVPQCTRLSTLLRSSRMGGCSINLFKAFCFLECKTRAGTLSWAVWWARMAEALQEIQLWCQTVWS